MGSGSSRSRPLSAVSPSMPKPLTRTSFLSVLQFFQCLSVSSISTFHHFSELQCFSLPHCSHFFVQFHASAPTREGEQLPPSRLGKGARGLGEFRRNFRTIAAYIGSIFCTIPVFSSIHHFLSPGGCPAYLEYSIFCSSAKSLGPSFC